MNNLTFITREEYLRGEGRGRYFKGRWAYASKVIGKIRTLDGVERVLELGPGPGGRPIVNGADTMGRTLPCDKNCKFIHDARIVPWPFPDKSYDLFIALQVFEHLRGRQREAFAEVRRIAHRAILTLPFQWRSENHNIGWKEYRKWFGEKGYGTELVENGKCRKYMLCFDFRP